MLAYNRETTRSATYLCNAFSRPTTSPTPYAWSLICVSNTAFSTYKAPHPLLQYHHIHSQYRIPHDRQPAIQLPSPHTRPPIRYSRPPSCASRPTAPLSVPPQIRLHHRLRIQGHPSTFHDLHPSTHCFSSSQGLEDVGVPEEMGAPGWLRDEFMFRTCA
jgi:hypothetical protein